MSSLRAMGDSNDWRWEAASSRWEAIERLQRDAASHLLVLDIGQNDAEARYFLRWLNRLGTELPILLLCDRNDSARLQEVVPKRGEILLKPFDAGQLETLIRGHLRSSRRSSSRQPELSVETDLSAGSHDPLSHDGFFVSACPIMQKLSAQAAFLAKSDVPVLILGEKGSGKSTVAGLIHKLSVRSGFKLRRLHCAEMPESVLEVELFGSGRLGVLGGSEKGCVLLEEIHEMPTGLQLKLSQTLQDLHRSELRNPAGQDLRPADVRILAASSGNLDRVLAAGQLREDLYYSLSAFTVHVPPLRQRVDEIPTLLHSFMHNLGRHYGLPPREFSASALHSCKNYSWPGNLKEMEAFVKRYLVTGEEERGFGEAAMKPGADLADVQFPRRAASPQIPEREAPIDKLPPKPESLKSLIQTIKSEAERNAIGAALLRTGWNRKAAARLLRVSYRTLLYKIEQYRMQAPETVTARFAAGELTYSLKSKTNGKAS